MSKYNKEELKQLISEGHSYEEIGRKFNVSRNAINKAARRFGLQKPINKVDSQAKGELFNNRKNWQSARSGIQKLARKIYFEANSNPKCAICGYSNHIEVAHIKAVNEFSDDTLISEINSLTNMIGLCPNHHWEFDNGILTI